MAEARIPPHSIEAEKAVLGALLTENDIYDSVSSIVGRSDFYRDAHRIIYEAIENIVRRGNRRVDMVLLTEELTRMKNSTKWAVLITLRNSPMMLCRPLM